MAGEKCAVVDEFSELLDAAIYKEIAAQAFYEAGQSKSNDPGAKALMAELAAEELQHANWLKGIKEKGLTDKGLWKKEAADLKISEYLTGVDTLDGTGLQDTLVIAMKREQLSMDFYLKMMAAIIDKTAKQLCKRLVQEEHKHKKKLEVVYDDLFFSED